MEAKGNDSPRCVVGLFHVRLHIRPHEVYESCGQGGRILKKMTELITRQGIRNKHGPVGSASLNLNNFLFLVCLLICVKKRIVNKLQTSGMKEGLSLQVLLRLKG